MISKSLARCLARISGDGYLNDKYIRYNNTCQILLEDFRRDISTEFRGIKITEGKVNSGTKFIQVHGRKTISRFKKHLNDFRNTKIHIPQEIKRANKEIQKEYLKAFYDDEGCVAIRVFSKTKEWKRNITLCSNSIRLLQEIKLMLLQNFNIKSNKIIRNNPQKKDRCYVLSITGKENIKNFREKIGFNHPLKEKRLELMIGSYKATSKNKEQFNIVVEELKKVGQRIGVPATKYSTTRNVGLLN